MVRSGLMWTVVVVAATTVPVFVDSAAAAPPASAAGGSGPEAAEPNVAPFSAGTTRVSVTSAGGQGGYASFSPAISADGRFVAFRSYDLIVGDDRPFGDVFVHDRQTGQTSVASVASGGARANDESYGPDVSADGRFVVFDSDASNLVQGDTNGWWDVFVRDQATGQTTRVSVSSTGAQGNGGSGWANVSGDGRFVAFTSEARNLVPGDTNGTADVFVRDLTTGQTIRVSVSSTGGQGNGPSSPAGGAALSRDGRFVGFHSDASNLVPGDTNGVTDVFIHDLTTRQTTRVGQRAAWPRLSADGRFVAYESLPAGASGVLSVWVHDRMTGQSSPLPAGPGGTTPSQKTGYPAISDDGRYVAFLSMASDLVPSDTNNDVDAFVHDRTTGHTTLVSTATDGTHGDKRTYEVAISASGASVVYASESTNLVPGDTNGVGDIFVHEAGPPATPGNLRAAADRAGNGVTLTWLSSAADGSTVVVERATGTGAFEPVGTTGAGATSWTDTTVSAGVTYSYRVRASNPFGASGWSAATQVKVPATPGSVPDAGYHPLAPARLFDTRDGNGAKLAADAMLEVVVTGLHGVPAAGVAAVSVNVTVTEPDAAGYLTVYGCGDRPLASNLNYTAGQTVPNEVIAPVSADGSICLYTMSRTHVLADINGWYPAGGGFHALTPSRVFDTRDGRGGVPNEKLASDGMLSISITGIHGVPAAGVSAVSINVTVTEPDAAGYLTVYGCGDRPLASNLNYIAGQTVPNEVIAPVSADGSICLYTMSRTHVLADINGWFEAGSTFGPLTPHRVLDTRNGTGGVPASTIRGDNIVMTKVNGRGGVPLSGVAAVSLNVTVTGPDAAGYVTVYGCGPRPHASNLNYQSGQTIPNAVLTEVSADGYICLYTMSPTHLVVDVNGWFPGSAQLGTLYEEGFSGSVGPEWSSTATAVAPLGERFLGQFGNDSITLTLPGVPVGVDLTVGFDLYLIDTWDGNEDWDGDPDFWELTIDGTRLIHTTFAVTRSDAMQSYPDDYPASYPERTGAAANDSLGYTWVGDSTYRIERTVHTTSPTLTVTFTANQLQELSDESWGIDNVIVRR